MKKTIISLLAAVAATAVIAAENDTIVTFGTKGPDTYADGKTVLDGERYALVYADDASAVTIAADGAISGGTKVAVVALAKGGCLPTVGFQVSAKLIDNPVRDNFRLFLLDTRLADGVTLAPGGSKPTAVNGFAPVEGAQVSVTQISALPEGFTQPKFKKIDVLDDTVVLTIENTLPCIQYTLDGGLDAKGTGLEGVDAKNGAGEIQFIVPKKDGGETFRVIRK